MMLCCVVLWCVVSGCVAKNAPSAETPDFILQYFRDMAARVLRSESEPERCKCEANARNNCKKIRDASGVSFCTDLGWFGDLIGERFLTLSAVS